jgi:tRNA pseudouridine55 synthase
MDAGRGPQRAAGHDSGRAAGPGSGPLGILVLDKPPGLPSNRVLGQVKRLLGVTKMGFLGTLDPLASGVLPVFVGRATRLIPLFEGLWKTYRVTMKLGERTATFDAEGEVTERRPLDGLTPERVRAAILAKAGRQRQKVPAYSAVKVGGVPAYKLARQGVPVPERVRDVELWDLAVEAIELPLATFRVTCTAGTYIRSLVEDLGLALGPGAHVTALRRLACGGLFTLADSVTLEGIGEAWKAGRMEGLRNPAEFLPEHAPLRVTPETELLLRDGRTVLLELPAPGQLPNAVAGAAGAPRTGGAGDGAADGSLDGAPGAGDWVAGQSVKALRSDGSLVAVGVVTAELPGAPQGRLGFRPTRVL